MRGSIGAMAASRPEAFGGGAIAGGHDQARQPAERRVAGAFALLDLAGIKRLAVAATSAFITGCSG